MKKTCPTCNNHQLTLLQRCRFEFWFKELDALLHSQAVFGFHQIEDLRGFYLKKRLKAQLNWVFFGERALRWHENYRYSVNAYD